MYGVYIHADPQKIEQERIESMMDTRTACLWPPYADRPIWIFHGFMDSRVNMSDYSCHIDLCGVSIEANHCAIDPPLRLIYWRPIGLEPRYIVEPEFKAGCDIYSWQAVIVDMARYWAGGATEPAQQLMYSYACTQSESIFLYNDNTEVDVGFLFLLGVKNVESVWRRITRKLALMPCPRL